MSMPWYILASIDLPILHAINGHAGGWILDRIFDRLSSNIDLSGLVFVAPYWYFWWANRSEPAALRADRLKVGCGLIGSIATIIVARAFAETLPYRERPMYDPSSGYVMSSVGNVTNLEHWSAFPSDTAAFTIALALGLYRLSPRLSVALSAYAVLVAGVIRIYFGIHYPTDIVVGLAIGATVAWAAYNRFSIALVERCLRWEAAAPGPFYLAAFAMTVEMAIMFNAVREIVRDLVHFARHSPGAATWVAIGAGLTVSVLGTAGWHYWHRRGAGDRNHPPPVRYVASRRDRTLPLQK